jgi:hypothetical protein
MKYPILNKAAIIALIFLVSACQSEYTKLVKSELKSGKKNDTIFYNLRFGNTRQEFFKICWDLNKEGKVTNGPSNNTVQTTLIPKDSSETLKKIQMLFYGKFNSQDIMTGMDITFSYNAWSLWNNEFNADKLLPVVQDTLMKWYPGNPFMKVKGVLVKVDGNRQIELKQESDRDVSVKIEDLEYKYKTLVK